MKTFNLNEDQSKKADKWIRKHKCDIESTAIGGKISYLFTSTGLGMCAEVRCICGKKKDLTEIDKW